MTAFGVVFKLTGSDVGALLAFPCAVIAFHIPLLILWILGKFFEYLFPPRPDKCEDNKCTFYVDDYRVRIGTFRMYHSPYAFYLLDYKPVTEEAIIYMRCLCGHEYVDFGGQLRTKVNNDGTLQPFMIQTKWRGWRRDKRATFGDDFFKINGDMLVRLRGGTQEAVDDFIVVTI